MDRTTKIDGIISEQQRKKNEAAIQLPNLWCEGVTEKEAQGQKQTWEYFKKALDEDRLSNRKPFP